MRTIAVSLSVSFIALLAAVILAFYKISETWGANGVAFTAAFLAIALLVIVMALVFGGYGLIQQWIWGRATSSMAEATASTAKTMATIMRTARAGGQTIDAPEWNTFDGWGMEAPPAGAQLPAVASGKQQSPREYQQRIAQQSQMQWPDEFAGQPANAYGDDEVIVR